MATRIGFLRAVNVGRRTVPMSRLKAVGERLGYADVWTFLNSGNIVFDGAGTRERLEAALGDALEEEFGFECTTFVRSPAELRKALAVQPFERTAGDTYFITFLKSAPPADVVAAMQAASNEFDTLVVDGRDVHWHMRGKSTDTLLKASTWRLVGRTGSTSRNVTMLTKLLGKLDAPPSVAGVTRGRRPPA